MENKQKDRKLSRKAVELIEEQAQKTANETIKSQLDDIKEQFSKLVAENYLNLKENQRNKVLEDKIELADYVLKKYLPLKKELKVVDEIFLSENFKNEKEFEFYEKMMTSQFKPVVNDMENKTNYYYGLFLLLLYLNSVMDLYKKDKEQEIKADEETFKQNENQRILDRINRNKKKLYILENLYKQGKSAQTIKLEYENERRFIYDKRELLSEISEYLNFIYAILDIVG